MEVTTISVNGITEEILNLKITAYDPTIKDHWNILLDNHWCHGLEPTNEPEKVSS